MLHGRHYGKVNISFCGNSTTLRKATLDQYLPRLMRFVKSYPRNYPIPAEDCLGFGENNHTAFTLDIIFRYLRQIDRLGTSSYLLDALENHWIESWPRNQATKQLFSHLGRVLGPNGFGCCRDIWNTMQQFLIRHCTDIVKDSLYGWTSYINALENAYKGVIESRSLDLTAPLSEILWKAKLDGPKLADLARQGQLSKNSLSILDRLIYARRPHEHPLQLKYPDTTLWPGGRELHGYQSYIRDIRKARRRQISGKSIDPYELQYYYRHYPEAINLDLRKLKQLEDMEDYGDEFDASDDGYSYPEDLISFYDNAGYHAPRYIGNPRQLEDAYLTMDHPVHDYRIMAGV